MIIRPTLRFALLLAALPLLLPHQSIAWGSDGHRMINRLAVQFLPKDMPEFLRSPEAQSAMDYYGPEPDHWKSSSEPELAATGSPDHFIDMEYADLAGTPLPRKRYDYFRALAYAQKAHPDLPLSPEKVGFQPYAANEGYERLKSAMRDYRTLLAEHKDVKPVEAEILFTAGILGHFVADGSQPLHTTIQYNGWTGPNPANYNTEHRIHAYFESDFVKANIQPQRDIAPLIAAKPELLGGPTGDVFTQYLAYLRTTNSYVEPLYKLDKSAAFTGTGTPEGNAFADARIAAGVTELRDLIYTAWVRSADPLPQYHAAQKSSDN